MYLLGRVGVLSVQLGGDGNQLSVGEVPAGLPQQLMRLWQLRQLGQSPRAGQTQNHS